jgi:hypothetical protein
MLRRARLLLLTVPLSCVLAGCGPTTGSPSPASQTTSVGSQVLTKLWVNNDTTIAVTIVVNGTMLETVPGNTVEQPIKADLPPLPWHVEAVSPSGRLLTSLDVHYPPAAARVDLSCGRLELLYGTVLLGPAFSPGPEPCD